MFTLILALVIILTYILCSVILSAAAHCYGSPEFEFATETIIGGSKDKEMSFLVFGDDSGIRPRDMARKFIARGYKQSTNPKSATVVWCTLSNKRYDRASFDAACDIKNLYKRESHEAITDKEMLNINFPLLFPHLAHHIAPTIPLAELHTCGQMASASASQPVWILRPVGNTFCGGAGIVRVTNDEQLDRAKKMYTRDRIEHVIASKYIDDVYTFSFGAPRKFHLRSYFMIRGSKKGRALIEPSYITYGTDRILKSHGQDRSCTQKILTAALPYVRGDYENNKVHDTHFDSTPESVFFPADCHNIVPPLSNDDVVSIAKQMEDITRALFDMVAATIAPYDEALTAYDVFAMDLLLERTADGPHVILMEVNDRVGYAHNASAKDHEFLREFSDWQIEDGFEYLRAELNNIRGGSDEPVAVDHPIRSYRVFGAGDGLDPILFRKALSRNGYEEKTTSKNVDVVFSSQTEELKYVPESYSVHSLVKDLYQVPDSYSQISNKKNLHVMGHKGLEGVIAKTVKLTDLHTCGQRVWILRPSVGSACSGKGIVRVENDQQLEAAKRMYAKNKSSTGELVLNTVIASEYVENIYLFDRRKFHLRVYMMVLGDARGAPGCLGYKLFGYKERKRAPDDRKPFWKILTAGLPYVHGDYDNVKIHDSHAGTTPGTFFFPMHSDRITPALSSADIDNIFEQTNEVCAALFNIIKDTVEPYEESKTGYRVFGLDMFIRTETAPDGQADWPSQSVRPRVMLIEVNDRPAYHGVRVSPELTQFQGIYFDWIINEGCEPLLREVQAAQ